MSLDCEICHGNHYRRLPNGGIVTCECVAGDSVERPAHYTAGAIETYGYISGWNLNFAEGNVIKYVTRWRIKGGVVDLEKARWYLDRLIEEAKS